MGINTLVSPIGIVPGSLCVRANKGTYAPVYYDLDTFKNPMVAVCDCHWWMGPGDVAVGVHEVLHKESYWTFIVIGTQCGWTRSFRLECVT